MRRSVDLSNLDRGRGDPPRNGARRLGQGIVVTDGLVQEVGPTRPLGRQADVASLVALSTRLQRRSGRQIVDRRSIDEVRTAVHGLTVAAAVTFDPDAIATAVAALSRPVRHQATRRDAVVTSTASHQPPPGRDIDATGPRAADRRRARDPTAAQVRSSTSSQDRARSRPSTDATATLAAPSAAPIAQGPHDRQRHPKSWTLPGATIKTWITFAGTGDGQYGPLVDAADLDGSPHAVRQGRSRARPRTPRSSSARTA